jgi:hypothetical protein
MSKKKSIPQKPCIVRLEDQLYTQSEVSQMVRIDYQGRQIPRVRMSKKEKLKLRQELHKINEMGSYELANKIVDSGVKSVSVVNPKTEEQLRNGREEIKKRA